ncbi:MAG: hypothetical protein RLN90_10385 [Balneolaceae bacterium]
MKVQDLAVRNQLEKRLLNGRSELLWSYNKNNLKSLSDNLIISKFLAYGNKNDWKDLKIAFDKSSIKHVWENEMLLAGFNHSKQKALVSFFFNSINPSRYISDNRRRKLNRGFERSF